MIVKRVPNPKAGGSKAARVGGLVKYIENDRDKLELRFATGDFITDSPEGQCAEMIALSMEATRSKDPVDHWLLSWQAGEQPTEEQCREAVEILKEHLGMGPAHQAICALHRNTDNLHLHVILNRTDPERHRVADKGWSINNAHKALSEIVKRQGWQTEVGALLAFDDNGKPQRIDERGPALTTKARDFENATGLQSAQRAAINEVPSAIRGARNWSEVHASLARVGVSYERKGSGAVLRVDGVLVKASVIGRDLSRKTLETRFGPFVPAGSKRVTVATVLRSDAVAGEPSQSRKEYRQYVQAFRERKESLTGIVRQRHSSEAGNQKLVFRQEREDLYAGAQWNGTALNVARSLMAADQARRKTALKEKQKRERETEQAKIGRLLSYEEYLRSLGKDGQAEQWRYRMEVVCHIKGGPGDSNQLQHRDIRNFAAKIEHDPSTGQSYVGYYSSDGGSRCFADKGKRVDVAAVSGRGAVLAAMQVASQKWNVLHIAGPPEFQMLCNELAREHNIRISNSLAQPSRAVEAPTPAAQAIAPSAYEAHRRDIASKVSETNVSKIDWMIAVRMRVTGHSKEEIAQQLVEHAERTRGSETRDWKLYARRTAEAAHGPKGEREAALYKDRATTWKQIERRSATERDVRSGGSQSRSRRAGQQTRYLGR